MLKHLKRMEIYWEISCASSRTRGAAEEQTNIDIVTEAPERLSDAVKNALVGMLPSGFQYFKWHMFEE